MLVEAILGASELCPLQDESLVSLAWLCCAKAFGQAAGVNLIVELFLLDLIEKLVLGLLY